MKRREMILKMAAATPLGIALSRPALAQNPEAGEVLIYDWASGIDTTDITEALRDPNSDARALLSDVVGNALTVQKFDPNLSPCGAPPTEVFRAHIQAIPKNTEFSGDEYLNAINGAANAAYGDEYVVFQSPFGFAFMETIDCAQNLAESTQTTATISSSIEWPPDVDTDPPDTD